jgi:hypothetical protein
MFSLASWWDSENPTSRRKEVKEIEVSLYDFLYRVELFLSSKSNSLSHPICRENSAEDGKNLKTGWVGRDISFLLL